MITRYDMDSIFGSFQNLGYPQEPVFPKANITHIGNITNLNLVVAGYTKSDLDISVKDKELIVATADDFKEGNSEDQARSEYHMAEFKRTFDITHYDPTTIESRLRNGILTITLKKSKGNELQKIPIK